MMVHSLQGMIFDVDGTLVDSNEAHAEAWSDALVEFGFPGTLDEVRPLIGMGGDKMIGKLTDLDPQGAQAKELLKLAPGPLSGCLSARAFDRSRRSARCSSGCSRTACGVGSPARPSATS